jgi:hypothetical protein
MSTRTCPDVSSLTRYLTSTLILSILIPVKRSDQSELCVCVCVCLKDKASPFVKSLKNAAAEWLPSWYRLDLERCVLLVAWRPSPAPA